MNIPQNPWIFAFLGATIIALGCFVFILFPMFSKSRKRRYDFLCDFPMELLPIEGAKRNSGIIVVAFFSLALALSYAFPLLTSDLYPQLRVFLLVVFGFAVLTSSMGYAVFSVQPTYPRAHILFFSLLGGFEGVLMFLCAIAFLHLQALSSSLGIFFAVIYFVLGAAVLIILLNPKLKQWAKLDSKPAEDGTVVIMRPRPFVLAFSEWLLFGIQLLSSILLLVGTFLINTAAM